MRRLNGDASLCDNCPLPPHSNLRCLWLTLTTAHGLHLPVPRAWLLLLGGTFVMGTLAGAAIMGACGVAVGRGGHTDVLETGGSR